MKVGEQKFRSNTVFRFMAALEITLQIATEICGAISGFHCSYADGMKHVVLLHQMTHNYGTHLLIEANDFYT